MLYQPSVPWVSWVLSSSDTSRRGAALTCQRAHISGALLMFCLQQLEVSFQAAAGISIQCTVVCSQVTTPAWVEARCFADCVTDAALIVYLASSKRYACSQALVHLLTASTICLVWCQPRFSICSGHTRFVSLKLRCCQYTCSPAQTWEYFHAMPSPTCKLPTQSPQGWQDRCVCMVRCDTV